MLNRRIDSERWDAIVTRVGELSAPHSSFYVMTGLSAIIAAFGLLVNSGAVVIGAMLVAPLMGPIFGIGLGIATGERRLLPLALRAEMFGVLLAFGMAMLIGLVVLRPEFGQEILGRTQPTLYDLIIALVSGFAGAFALVDERISPALPGVAVATAIVPPLATSGLCLAAGHYQLAAGAFLLFGANFLAIQIAAAIVFTLAGRGHVRALEDFSVRQFVRRFAVSLGALLVITVVMTRTLVKVVSDDRRSRSIHDALSRELGGVAGARLSEVRLTRDHDTLRVTAVVFTPRLLEPGQVAAMESTLRRTIGSPLDLVVRSVQSYDVNRSGLAFAESADPTRTAEQAHRDSLVERVTVFLNDRLDSIPGAQLIDLHATDGQTPPAFVALVQTPTAVSPLLVAEWQGALRQRVGVPVQLSVRSVLIREADSTRYRYEPAPDSVPASRAIKRRRK